MFISNVMKLMMMIRRWRRNEDVIEIDDDKEDYNYTTTRSWCAVAVDVDGCSLLSLIQSSKLKGSSMDVTLSKSAHFYE